MVDSLPAEADKHLDLVEEMEEMVLLYRSMQ